MTSNKSSTEQTSLIKKKGGDNVISLLSLPELWETNTIGNGKTV